MAERVRPMPRDPFYSKTAPPSKGLREETGQQRKGDAFQILAEGRSSQSFPYQEKTHAPHSRAWCISPSAHGRGLRKPSGIRNEASRPPRFGPDAVLQAQRTRNSNSRSKVMAMRIGLRSSVVFPDRVAISFLGSTNCSARSIAFHHTHPAPSGSCLPRATPHRVTLLKYAKCRPGTSTPLTSASASMPRRPGRRY